MEETREVLLSTMEMGEADRLTIEAGLQGRQLMEAAGQSIARIILEKLNPGRTLVLCGPGNNGGDGFVVARALKENGWPVTVTLMGTKDRLKGDARLMADLWDGEIQPLAEEGLGDYDIIVDGLFGAGLDRPLEGALLDIVRAANDSNARKVAIDVPSGLSGDSGLVLGGCLEADLTVTFFRRKPGHLLYPGKALCGDLYVTDIGISGRVLDEIGAQTWLNSPAVWGELFPVPSPAGHKYSRGHSVVVSGDLAHTGASRLAAGAALRIGSGLVSVACAPEAVPAHAAQLTAVMIRSYQSPEQFADYLADHRLNAWCIGPANGVTNETRNRVLAILAAGKQAVLDADAITVFRDRPEELFAAIGSDDRKNMSREVVLTPHAGEFGRLFPDLMEGTYGFDRLKGARTAAERSGAVLLLKGPDTVVVSPDGRAVIMDDAPADLATAGSGDVLSGLVTGLLAQGMPAFEAASAAVWLHAEAARVFGAGLTAEDISPSLPTVLEKLREKLH
ncbi:NAD(P)H-hydrate dehydratase [Emcibacter nanhaiensis]|uniref:Bifunctional NAD(P)H-hydrate repair enzyme n=1 Tax=Emcibacter nanhaiensis TaxID=1505037 RepID=A0A501PSD3_9PROT|nr:NAD(P)H-hydrate dehydratase [Emcibacter nanhaiensis]TPD62874.1 NAD(P)H-hydrate dehydratase [Emcibacter nanhaiensis]